MTSAWEHLPPDQRRALLLKLLRDKQGAAAPQSAPASETLPVLVPDPASTYEPFPLTDIQYAYWIGRAGLVELGQVGSHVYLEVEVPIADVPRLSRAWQRLVARHEMLRVTITPDGRQQFQRSVEPYWIATTDLRGASPDVAEAAFLATREALSHRVYPPERWPLFDLRAFLLGDARTRLCISFDMLMLDLRSFQILLEELFALYLRPDALLPALDSTFRDYVLAEAALRDTPLYERSRAYWMKRLSSLPPPPELPLAKPAAQLGQYRFSRRSATLPAERWQLIRQAAGQRQTTPAAVLLTAFAATLASWSTNRHFTLNLTVFNRLPLHPQVNRLLGDFTSTNLLEIDLRLPDDFAARARRVREQLWTDLEHRHLGGVQVLRELAREHGARHAVSPVVFTSHLASGAGDTVPSPVPIDVRFGVTQTPQVWLYYQVFERDGALMINWDVVDELFPPGLLDDSFAANLALLERLATDPAAWDDGRFPAPPERQLAVRRAANATAAPLDDRLLHELFEARARSQPDAPALIGSAFSKTYGEIAARADGVAHRLLDCGVRAGELVAIVMEKGWEQAVAALGILEVGAAYLPIDPEVPAERLRWLLENGEVRVALSQSFLRERLGWPDDLTLLSVDDAPPETRPKPMHRGKPGDLAYVIYTSGSTGAPKGVMIDHRGAVNTILDLNARHALTPADRVLGLSALTFDLSVYDLFGIFAAGGCVVLPDPAARRDPQHWLQLMRQERVTIWSSVPALLEMLVEGNPDPALPDLRLVMLSGDWIPLGLARHAKRTWPAAKLVSLGGATEASIWSILHVIDDLPEDWKSIPYGRPLLNQRFHVLDERHSPRPDWVPGELFIAGDGLALGYWRDPERTRERFPVIDGERLYRTGDLGRYRPDGSLEILGRVDRQVKIRGHRIELGEIEAVLRRDPAVKEAVVVVRGEPQQARHLAAYVIPAEGVLADLGPAPAPLVELPAESLGPFVSGDPERDAALRLLDRLEDRAAFKAEHRGRRPVGQARVALPAPESPAPVRRSERRFALNPIPLERFAALLSVLREQPTGRRLHGSPGGLYPIQLYASVKPGRVAGLAGGAYAYDPIDHQLEPLSRTPIAREAYHAVINRPLHDEAAFALFLIVELRAIAPIYGDRSLHFATIEAGLMTQLLELAAPAQALGLCQIGDLSADSLPSLLQLGPTHQLLHSLIGGALDPDPARSAQLPAIAELREEPRIRRMLERIAALDDGTAAALLAALEEP